MGFKEQRSYVRFDIEGQALLRTQDGTGRVVKAGLFDISFLGLGVSAEERLESGMQVEFEFTTKMYDSPVIGSGKIAHVQEVKKGDTSSFRIGIEFIDLNRKAITHILTLIQHQINIDSRKKGIY